MFSLQHVLEIAESRGMYINYAEKYCEPGYGYGEDGPVMFSDWNNRTKWNEDTRESETIDDTPERIANILEHMGCSLEWDDEWSTCDECYGAIRTSPDCHSWLPSYKIFNECEIVCKDCILGDVEAYAETLEDNPDVADTMDINWPQYGYERTGERYESGFHPGQNDNPHEIAESLRERGITRYLFEIDSQGQFDMTFVVWVHESEIDRLEE